MSSSQECFKCKAKAVFMWPNMPKGWSMRGDQKYVACPKHTQDMPPWKGLHLSKGI